MSGAIGRIRRLGRRFRRAEGGVSAVEFALLLPVMIAIYFGTMEASTAITMDRKVQSVAGTVGDLVARYDGNLPSSRLRDYFQAASGVMTPYPSDNLRQVVTAVSVARDGTATVAWTYQYMNGRMSTTTPHRVGRPYPLPAAMVEISRGRTVIAAEASTSFVPLFGVVFDQSINLFRSSFYMPRYASGVQVR